MSNLVKEKGATKSADDVVTADVFITGIRKKDHVKEEQEPNPSDESLWTDFGHWLSQSENYQDALIAFNKAVISTPNPLNLYNLGDAYLAMDGPEKSIAPLVEATQMDPGFLLAHYDLSLAYIKMKKYDEGVNAAMAALQPDPEMKLQRTNLGLGAMTNMGLCLMNLSRYEEAVECFRRNIKLLSPTYFNLGLTLFRMKHYKEALGNFQKALDIDPDDPEYLNLTGQTYIELGENKVAERYLRDSVKKDPDYAMGYYDLGVFLAKFKTRRKEAFRCFMTATKLDPTIEWAYYSIACLYALEGNKEQALDYLKQSFERGLSDKKHIKSDPDMDSLKEEKEFKKMLAKYFPKKKGGIKGLADASKYEPKNGRFAVNPKKWKEFNDVFGKGGPGQPMNDNETFILGLSKEIQKKLKRITDEEQRSILINCLRRGEEIPDFAWKPLQDLREKLEKVQQMNISTKPELKNPKRRPDSYWDIKKPGSHTFERRPVYDVGEHLPPLRKREVEIARITLASTMGDVISIRARRSGQRIYYRVVDENDSVFSVKPGSSKLPLNVAEMAAFVRYFKREESSATSAIGEFLEWNSDDSESREELRDFICFHSDFYPELEEYLDLLIDHWILSGEPWE